MLLRRPVSLSTVVALAIAGITVVAVTPSLLDGRTTETAEAAAAEPAGVADRASGPLVQAAAPNLRVDGQGTIQEAAPVSGAGLVLRGAIGVTAEEPVAGATASTRPQVPGECPVMTDSIRRLYLGFLEREPTADELSREIERYRSGESNLEGTADALAGSGRFRSAYGPLSDEGYVQRVYANTIGEAPDEAELNHWLTSLGNDYPRGAVMLAFTESADFVRTTKTTRPLSGFLAWYPAGTHWYCGVGPRDDLPILPLTGGPVYADYLFVNPGPADVVAGLTTVLDGFQRVPMGAAELPGGYTDFRWDGLFVGADHYGDAIDVAAGADTGWVVVFYPTSVGRQRLGWHLPS